MSALNFLAGQGRYRYALAEQRRFVLRNEILIDFVVLELMPDPASIEHAAMIGSPLGAKPTPCQLHVPL